MRINIKKTNQIAQGPATQPACIAPARSLTTSDNPAQSFFKHEERRIIPSYINFAGNVSRNDAILKLENGCVPEPNSGCVIWLGTCDPEGYGRITYKGKNWHTHRFSYTIFKGKISKGKVVRHKCNCPSCCNPEHLILGTQQENIMDAVRQGRWQRSGKYKDRKRITPAQVLMIRNSKLRQVELARMFGVTKAAIHMIKYRKRQAWVSEASHEAL